MQKERFKCINIQNSDCKQFKHFSFCFSKQRGFSLLFLLTTLKSRVILSKSLFEAVKGP